MFPVNLVTKTCSKKHRRVYKSCKNQPANGPIKFKTTEKNYRLTTKQVVSKLLKFNVLSN